VADDREPWRAVGAGYDSAEDLAELRELLVGAERRRLRELERRLDAAGLTPEQIAELLPEAARDLGVGGEQIEHVALRRLLADAGQA
jgi:hypothetical protein